jgi:hypothetical protein
MPTYRPSSHTIRVNEDRKSTKNIQPERRNRTTTQSSSGSSLPESPGTAALPETKLQSAAWPNQEPEYAREFFSPPTMNAIKIFVIDYVF